VVFNRITRELHNTTTGSFRVSRKSLSEYSSLKGLKGTALVMD